MFPKQLISLRQQEPSLNVDAYVPVYSDTQLIVYIRQAKSSPRFLIVLNLSHSPAHFTPTDGSFEGIVEMATSPEREGQSICLASDEGILVRLTT
ncbi:hypothetical protein GCM10028819_44360 [Spirosoma humi]